MTPPTTSPIDTNERTRGMMPPPPHSSGTRPRSRSHRRKSPSRSRSSSPYSRRTRRRSRSRSRSRSPRRNSREFLDRKRDTVRRDRAGSRGSKSSRGSMRSRSKSPRPRDYPRSRDRRRSRSRSYERPHYGHYGHDRYDRPDSYYGRGPPPVYNPPQPTPSSRRRRRDTPPGVSLLVRNLSNQVTTQDLHAAFARIGELRDVYIPLDYHSKLPKGFAFIEYANPEQARNAKAEMDKFVMKGRELEVVFAQEKRKTPGEMIHRGDSPPPRGGSGMYGGGGARGGQSFDRSSSFERYRQREGRR